MTPAQRAAALRLAEWFDTFHPDWVQCHETAALLRELVQEPAQEPVAHVLPSDLKKLMTSECHAPVFSVAVGTPDERSVPLYARPQRPLTDAEIDAALDAAKVPEYPGAEDIDRMIARAIERALGIVCIGNDPLCPCQDGDSCHYKDTPTTKGWPIP